VGAEPRSVVESYCHSAPAVADRPDGQVDEQNEQGGVATSEVDAASNSVDNATTHHGTK